MDILLYNSKDEVVTAYTTNENYEINNQITIKDGIKNYKVVDLEKYRVMGRKQQITLQLKVVK